MSNFNLTIEHTQTKLYLDNHRQKFKATCNSKYINIFLVIWKHTSLKIKGPLISRDITQ